MRRPALPTWLPPAALLLAAGAVIWHQARTTTFYFDEWEWILDRRGAGAGTWLEPHNQHLSLVSLAVYKLLFTSAGLDSYLPYRAAGVLIHLACCALLFVYVRRRAGDGAALLAAALLAFLGPAYEILLWPFQLAWTFALACGVAALLALDRGDRAGDLAACALLALALASSGLGVAIGAGIAVELALAGRRRAWWIVAGPAALYALWTIGYQDADITRDNVMRAPGYLADASGAALAALAGLAQETLPTGNAHAPAFAPTLLVTGAALLGWRLVRAPAPPRVLALLTTGVSFWLLTAASRGHVAPSFSSRYLYVGAVVILLLVAELASGRRLAGRAAVVATLLAGFALVSNVQALRVGGAFLRAQADFVRADLGALELARSYVAPEHVAREFPAYPFIHLTAGAYADGRADLSHVAAGDISTLPEDPRRAADAELISAGAVRVESAARDAVCGRELTEALPRGGAVLVTAPRQPTTIAVRRFASRFPEKPLARLSPDAPLVLRIAADPAVAPWRLQARPGARVCVLA